MGNARVSQAARRPDANHSFDPGYFKRLFAIEDRHFWFAARNRVIATIASQIAAGLRPGYRVLDVGCGTGSVLRVLELACRDGMVLGMDLHAQALRYARERTRCRLVQADVHLAPFRAQFELVGMFDVLEHLADDMGVLRNLHGMLAPGGTLLLTVPAHSSLWSYFDEAAHHCRRYEPAELRRKLTRTGYQVEYLTQFNASLFPLIWLGRRLAVLIACPARDRRGAGHTDRSDDLALSELRVRPVVNELLAWLLTKEAALVARRCRLPIGASLLTIARKAWRSV
jgi:2-polyprenyl-3-methyl-5-hydroxy-6-metoxy-1,4-benzoquinol methylase